MTTRSLIALIATAFVLIASTVAFAGGWATVTLNGMPDYFVAGKAVPITFLVRAHGVTLQDGLKTGVTAAMAGEKELRFATAQTGNLGEYKAIVTLPKPGEWTIQIESGWMGIPFSLVPMKAIAPDSPAPAPVSQIERGERLFVERGCIGCHENRDVRSKNLTPIGPNLTGRQFPPDALKAFLADPSKSWKGAKEPQIGQMPNLHLTPQDIDAIVAFIDRPRA
jgi:mono/diheme cytochrome c family protein